jgi:enoyl-CoA hydratase
MSEGSGMTNLYGLSDDLIVEADGPVRIVTLNRPDDRNAASTAMLFALSSLAEALAADAEARAVVLTGAGTAFSAGGDFQHLLKTAGDPMAAKATLDNSRRFITAMIDLPIPAIAAVNGAAVGFGATLAALCDIVLMAEEAYFAEPHVNVGLILGDGISVTWPFYVSLLKAKEFILTSDRIPAADAVQCGLANRTCRGEDLMSEALGLAHRIAAQPASAVRGSKQVLNLYLKAVLDSVLEPMLSRQFEQTSGPDHGRIIQGMVDRQRRKHPG